MKPAFALSLSADGIALLYRAQDGWRSVAETPFDTDDLPSALAAMRDGALRLVPEGVFCKLVLPNDQIRYLSVETGDLPSADRIAAARQALEGATPYAVDELAFDISIDGGQTHIAAVALETLDEAETFAAEHGFGPVSFVAVPENGSFQGEPFFGTTRSIRGTSVEPDSTAIAVVGPVQVPAPDATKAPGPEAAPPLAIEPDAAEDLPPIAELDAVEAADAEPALPIKDAATVSIAKIPAAPPAAADPQEAAGFSSRRGRSAPAKAEPTAPAPAKKAIAPRPAPAPEPVPAAAKPLAAPVLAASDGPEASAARTAIPPAPAALRAEPAPARPEAAAAGTAVRGKPRYLGVTLTAALLLFMATVAVWAVFGDGGFFAESPEQAPSEEQGLSAAPPVSTGEDDTAGQPEPPAAADQHDNVEPAAGTDPAAAIAPQVSVLADQPDPGVAASNSTGEETASAEAPTPGLAPSAEDEAAADGVELPEEGTETAFLDPDSLQPGGTETALPEPVAEEPLDPLAQAARYAATGVWPVAPELEDIPASTGLEPLYTASIDQNGAAPDAVALPQPGSFETDSAPEAIASPAAAGAAFDLDARGLVKATPEGTLNPDGIMIYLGRPAVVPPQAPERSDPAAEALAEEVARNQVLSRKRPKARPADLAEQFERARLGGLSRAELASLRPRQRPASLKPAEAEQQPATAQAVAASVVPRGRPANFAALVDRARRNSQNQVQTAAAVPAAAAAAAPSIPTAASVARRATVSNAINLRKLNLIGVYGTAAERRALVRLPSGRYKKVRVGDRIDGGRVIAIGESQLRYQKGGRNRTLEMPNG
ncbi:hypothetical protein [Leisingera sp. ANG-Vp]|uniref:hypothetical protein n=1 Tax=Leisingera sp. ANG-Vp TaxID=1577896 RepID=UPI00057DB2E6|nr:hypothetical protein [Leisingera sp. ANG-Vp]KIC18962.1 hypothetical protein RA20_13160 [Leisingera sp. ANG-Vp]